MARPESARATVTDVTTADVEVSDPAVLLRLSGPSGDYLRVIATELRVAMGMRGDVIRIQGTRQSVALAERDGPAAALLAVDILDGDRRMQSYQPYWAAIGHLRGRTGGSVSLAAGFAQIFTRLPWESAKSLLGYFYHFVVMFEAMFILTTVDAGTRVARFLVQDVLGRVDPRFGRHDYLPGVMAASALVVLLWGGFLYTGTIGTLWPMLGVANQLLATTALAVGTAVIVGQNPQHRSRGWVTAAPMLVVGVVVVTVLREWPLLLVYVAAALGTAVIAASLHETGQSVSVIVRSTPF